MYKRAFRSPTFNDLYYDRMGNRSVRPERATQTNLGLSCNLPVGSPFTQLSISADAYYNNVSDKIVAYPTTFVWKMVNFGRARVVGVDMTASAQCRIWREINASLVAAYTWQRATDRTTPSDCSYGSVLPYSPQHSGNISVALRSPWVTLGYSMVAVGSRYQLPENVQNNRIRGYVEQSISASHRLQLHTCALTLRAELLNMADSHYEVICFYPMPGRHWRAGINFEF